MFFTTNTQMATGGMTTPIMTTTPIIMPNQMGLKPSLRTGRVEDGSGKDHEGKVVNERAADQVNDADHDQDHIAVNGQLHDPVGCLLGDIGHGYEMAENGRPCNEHEKHAGGSEGFSRAI